MSSLRNAVQRRNHRERDQPLERQKWGLLEKRKDYKLRAADHKTKQRKVSALKQKASERNEDEFYFGMVNATSDGGIKRAKRGEENSGGGGKSLSVDVVRLMKTQDRGYLQTMLQKTRKERERIEQDVAMGEKGVRLESEPGIGRVVFGEDGEEIRSAAPEDVDGDEGIFDMDLDHLDDDDADTNDKSAIPKDAEENLSPEERVTKRRKSHALRSKRRKLNALREQEEKLALALNGVDHQRAQMAGTIGGVNKNGVKFKNRQRKR